MDYLTIDEIEVMYQPGSGRHWFDADTLRFFRGRLAKGGYRAADGSVYFVSSEQNHGMGAPYPRLYTVRRLTGPKGNIETVGEFQQYRSGGTASTAAKTFASGTRSA